MLCANCILNHSNSKVSKQHQVSKLSRGVPRSGTEVIIKMADKKPQGSFDDGQFDSDFEPDMLHNTDATNIDITVAQTPLPVLSSCAVTEDKVVGASNATIQSVTNMAYVGDFDVTLDFDREKCGITDIACLSDGRVVVCDQENKKVKFYNTDCKYLCCVEYSGYLFGITVVSSNTVVVIEDTSTLRYLQLDTQRGIKLDRYIDISPDAAAVSYANRKFAILDLEYRETVIINDSGVTLSVVKLTEVQGYIPPTILLDSTGTQFNICDYDGRRILCYNCQPGHTGVLWACNVSPNPHSVVHVGDHLVVVCKENLYDTNKSGQPIQEVLLYGKNFDVSWPLAVFQTSCRKLLFAGRWGNVVQIFQI